MSLSVKYALYLTLVNAIFIVSVLLVVGIVFWKDARELQTDLRQQTITAYDALRQERLLKAADFINKSLFNSVYQLDINGIHQLFDEFSLWLNIRHYYITDSQGLLLTDGSANNPNFLQPYALPTEDLAKKPVILTQMDGEQRLLLVINYRNQQAGYADIRLTDPEMQLALSRQEHNLTFLWMEFNQAIKKIGLYAILVTLLISTLLSWILSRKLTAPLVQLSQHARYLADGDFSLLQTQLNSLNELRKGMDELSVLSHSFYLMAIRLKDFFGTLEIEVQERTRELTEANQYIQELNEQLRSENLRMSAELNVTRRLQQMLLPKEQELKQIEHLDIASYMEPAEEVGGDYYDVLQKDGRVVCGIGDVTGHGLESGMLMLMVQTAVRTLLGNNVTDPQTCINLLNYPLYENIRRMDTDKNLTLLLLDYQDGLLRLSGQHEEVLVIRRHGVIEHIDTTELGFMVGITANISRFTQQVELVLEPDEGIVLYTDGITEAWNQAEEMYGIDRLHQVISKHWQLSADEIKEAVINDLLRHIGSHNLRDDITLLVIKRKECVLSKTC